jgi:alkyl hydroperoxide reductase subunit AhpF
MDNKPWQFDDESWALLPDLLGRLPEPVRLHIWGDKNISASEREAAELAQILSDRFDQIDYRLLPRRVNYPYYPVIGIMRCEGDEALDLGLRFIGLPSGAQMTSFIAAIQSVSFRGMTSEAKTRIRLQRLRQDVILELVTSADDEAGMVMAHLISNLAVVSPYVRSFIIMAQDFPQVLIRYSISHVPHLVINERIHFEGLIEEEAILEQISRALK